MRLFLDQDVYYLTSTFLKSLGHDVLTAADVGMSQHLIGRFYNSLHHSDVFSSPVTKILAPSSFHGWFLIMV